MHRETSESLPASRIYTEHLHHFESFESFGVDTARYCQVLPEAVLWRQGRDQTAGARENPKLPSDGFLAVDSNQNEARLARL